MKAIKAFVTLIEDGSGEEIFRSELSCDLRGLRRNLVVSELLTPVSPIIEAIGDYEEKHRQVVQEGAGYREFTVGGATFLVSKDNGLVIELTESGEPLIHADWDTFEESDRSVAKAINRWYEDNEEMM